MALATGLFGEVPKAKQLFKFCGSGDKPKILTWNSPATLGPNSCQRSPRKERKGSFGDEGHMFIDLALIPYTLCTLIPQTSLTQKSGNNPQL